MNWSTRWACTPSIGLVMMRDGLMLVSVRGEPGTVPLWLVWSQCLGRTLRKCMQFAKLSPGCWHHRHEEGSGSLLPLASRLLLLTSLQPFTVLYQTGIRLTKCTSIPKLKMLWQWSGAVTKPTVCMFYRRQAAGRRLGRNTILSPECNKPGLYLLASASQSVPQHGFLFPLSHIFHRGKKQLLSHVAVFIWLTVRFRWRHQDFATNYSSHVWKYWSICYTNCGATIHCASLNCIHTDKMFHCTWSIPNEHESG